MAVQSGTSNVRYDYDAANRPQDLIDLGAPGSPKTTFAYDANNQHTGTTYPNGVTISLVYDASQRLQSITGANGGGTLTSFSYSYANGSTDTSLRYSMSESDPTYTTTTTYAYDSRNRLTDATTTGSQSSRYHYGYDPNGNRTTTTIGGVASTTATFNDANQETSWIQGPTTFTYSYDDDGNLTGSTNSTGTPPGISGGPSASFTYNVRNQTVSMSGVNGVTLPMQYLESGQGERTDAGGTHYVNDSIGINSETTGGQTTYYTRMPGGKLVSQRIGSVMYYYLFDGQGSVVALTDGSGNIAAQYRYDPWGQSIDKTGPAADGNPFRYTGGYLDRTGYYKLGQRYYDPAMGRFTQLDPMGNGYLYASDNPVNRIDPSGLRDEDPFTGDSQFSDLHVVTSQPTYSDGPYLPEFAIFCSAGLPCTLSYTASRSEISQITSGFNGAGLPINGSISLSSGQQSGASFTFGSGERTYDTDGYLAVVPVYRNYTAYAVNGRGQVLGSRQVSELAGFTFAFIPLG